MINVHQVGYVLLWIVIATSVGISQEPAADYVSPSEVPRAELQRCRFNC